VNAYGPLFGSPEYSSDDMPILDPKTSEVTFFKMPVRDPELPERPGFGDSRKPMQPSAYWGEEKIWETRPDNHNGMFDGKRRVWFAATGRGLDNPAFCKKGSDHPSARVFPLEKSPRQVAMLDPKTMKWSFIDTCFGTHHLQFGYDNNDTLWFSGSGTVASWINTRTWDETGDAAKSQGWSPFILDTNGNGKRDAYVEPDQPIDPAKDQRIIPGVFRPYAVIPSPLDGSVWYTVAVFGGSPGVLRFDPKTGLSEIYNVPHSWWRHRQDRRRLGVTDERPSRKLRPPQVQGPAQRAEGDGEPLPGGLVVLQIPGPGFRGIGDNSAESSYYTWVDQYNTLGLGENGAVSTANLNDGFAALKYGQMVMLRIPYPRVLR
jgi:hypothetical protein